ncbi:MAG: hypothetical protein JXA01_00495 [Dehalococcoidia bacterium]|nr:hypothetical protein [Dehalococcoidia bacterium]
MFSQPVHPFMLALFPILFLFAINMDVVPGWHLIAPMAASLLMTLMVFLCFRLITGSYKKSGLVTSGFLLLFFLYGSVRDFIFSGNARSSFIINVAMLFVWAILFVLLVLIVKRSHSNFDTATRFTNIMALVLLGFTLINIGINYSKTAELAAHVKEEAANIPALSPADSSRDIYYIILDRYGRQDAIKEAFNYDNSKFIEYLEKKGFYVADRSSSNYENTVLSLPSCLNMRYLTAEEKENPELLLGLWTNSTAMQSLKAIGYNAFFIDGGLHLKNMEEYAQVLTYSGIMGLTTSPFEEALGDMTALSPLSRFFGGHGAAVSYALDTIPDMYEYNGPRFVYAHIICPHPPYVFNAGGEVKFKLFGNTTDDKTGYPANMDFINGRMQQIIDSLLSQENQPIIIVQGDHFMGCEGQQHIYKILNAYYFPGRDYGDLYENISPVNSFRVIFNNYFGGSFDSLQDMSYRWDTENNHFSEIAR